MASFVGSRSETKFSVESKFNKAVSDFGTISTASVLNDIASFELAWRKSIADDELPLVTNLNPIKVSIVLINYIKSMWAQIITFVLL